MTTLDTFRIRCVMIMAVCLLGILLLPMSAGTLLGADDEGLTPPKWISLTEDRGTINLRWFRVQGAVEYAVWRRDGEKGEFRKVGKAANPAYGDHDVKADIFYFYRIIPVDKAGVEGPPSDTRYYQIQSSGALAVGPPAWIAHMQTPEGVALSWSHPSSRQVLAFNLYRKAEGEATFNLLTSTLNTNYRDRNVKAGATYQYILTALDMKLQESDFSQPLNIVYTGKSDAETDKDPYARVETLEQVIQLTEPVASYTWQEYGFVSPTDLAYVPAEGAIYVSDSGTGLITVIGADREVVRTYGGNGSDPWHFERLLGIAVDTSGYLYAADAYRGEVVIFNLQGTYSDRIRLRDLVEGYFGTSLLVRYPWFRFGIVDVVSKPGGDLLVVDNASGWIYHLDRSHSLVNIVGERGYEPGRLQYPTFSNLDGNGRILVSDTLNSRVQMFDADGRFAAVIGEHGLGIGQFLRPKGLAVDSAGRIYVADSQLNVIQVFGPDGTFISLLGDERGLPLDLGSPNGLVFAEPNLLMICEKLSRRIQVRRLTGTFAAETVPEEVPAKGITDKRILAPVVTNPGSD